MARIRRGTQTLGTPEIAPGTIVLGESVRGLANRGSGSKTTTASTGYKDYEFYLTADGQIANISGAGATPLLLSTLNPDLRQVGYTFPGASGDNNEWVRTFQLPANYDPTRPIIATLHIVSQGSTFNTADIIAYWPCEDNSDATGNGHTLTISGAAAFVPAVVANGIQTVNTVTQAASFADSAALELASQDFYIWGWFRTNNKTITQTMISKGFITAGQQQFAISWNPVQDKFEFYVSNTGDSSISAFVRASTFGTITNGVFYFIEAYRSGNDIYIAINRGATDTVAWTHSVFNGTDAGRICIADSLFQTLTVDEIGIMIGRVPTTDERDCIYNGGAGSTYPDFCGA